VVINGAIHEESAHEAELGTLKGFRKDIRPHLFSGTILKVEVSSVVIMTNEKVFCLDVFGAFRTGDISVFSQGKSAHIVLIDDVGFDFVTLGFEKMTCPEDITNFVIKADEFAFTRTFGRDFVLRRGAGSSTTAKSKKRSRVTFAVVMKVVRCVDIPDDVGE
jgi:hypothetical protein